MTYLPRILLILLLLAPTVRAGDMGINLEGLSDYARAHMFVDLIKSARHFGSPDAPWDEKCPTDKDLWPTTDCGLVVAADTNLQPGDYVFSFTGHADIQVTGGTLKSSGYNRANNTTLGAITLDQNASSLYLAFRNTQTGIRNLKLHRPGFPLNTPTIYTKEFLDALKPFSTLRTMDLTRTNETAVARWSERPKATDATQTTKNGVAWEYIIRLANDAKKDLWINIPVRADDDYVTQLATLMKEQLSPDRKIYVEYSNEVWNGIFPQAGANLELAKAEVSAGGNSSLNAGDDKNEYFWAWKRVAKRTVEISNLFRKVYGDDALFSRVRPVLATQTANPFMTRMQVEFVAAHMGAPSKFLYGLAGAPYLGIDGKYNDRDDLTVDEIYTRALPESLKWVTDLTLQDQTIAVYHKLHHLSYEGGLGLEGEHSLAAKIAAQKDPRLEPMIDQYFQTWYAQGGELFMYFNLSSPYGKWGMWGLTEDIRRMSAKYKAVTKWTAQPASAQLAGVSLPATFSAAAFNIHEGGEAKTDRDGNYLTYFREGNSADYLLFAQSTGDYTLKIETATVDEGATLQAWLNGEIVGTFRCPNTGAWQKWGWTDSLLLKVEKGQSVLRFRVPKIGPNLRNITLEKK